MIRAKHVDCYVRRILFAMTLVAIVRNICSKIGVIAVRLNNYAIFIVAMLSRFKPSCAIFFKNVSTLTQICNSALNFAILVQAVFVEPHVETNAKIAH